MRHALGLRTCGCGTLADSLVESGGPSGTRGCGRCARRPWTRRPRLRQRWPPCCGHARRGAAGECVRRGPRNGLLSRRLQAGGRPSQAGSAASAAQQAATTRASAAPLPGTTQRNGEMADTAIFAEHERDFTELAKSLQDRVATVSAGEFSGERRAAMLRAPCRLPARPPEEPCAPCRPALPAPCG